MISYRWIVGKLLNKISDPEMEEEIVRYLTEGEAGRRTKELSDEELRDEKDEIHQEIECVKTRIIDAFDERGRRYNKVASLFIVFIVVNWWFSLQLLQEIGLVMSLAGSIILSIGIIHGMYWTYGLFLSNVFGNPSRYYEKATLNDTVDGVYGVLFLITSFIIQIFAVVTPAIFQ